MSMFTDYKKAIKAEQILTEIMNGCEVRSSDYKEIRDVLIKLRGIIYPYTHLKQE